jgi:hypothetical protein
MRAVPLLAILLALVGAAIVALAVTSRGSAEPAVDSEAGIPPLCFDTWDEATGAGWPTPEPGHAAVIFESDPTPSPGPPFDLYATPVPPGFDSWDEVIDSWKMANDAGLLDDPPSTPEFVAPPPPGCETWDEFLDWLASHGLGPAS